LSAPTAGELRDHMVGSRIAGSVATPREDNLRNIDRMLADRPDYDFGLVRRKSWTPDEVLAVMASRCGISPDPAYTRGPDTIDPDLVLAALDRWRARLVRAVERGERVLLATGHPTGVLAVHLQVAAALRRHGCEVLSAAPDWSWPWEVDSDFGRRRARHVLDLTGVHLLATGGELLHTHAADPVRALLAGLDRPPDLVVADHGWAGGAAEVGLDALGMADCNDPALFVGEAEGKPLDVLPLDDNVAPPLYRPLSAYLLQDLG